MRLDQAIANTGADGVVGRPILACRDFTSVAGWAVAVPFLTYIASAGVRF